MTTGSVFFWVETFYCELFYFFAPETGLLVAGTVVEHLEGLNRLSQFFLNVCIMSFLVWMLGVSIG